MSLHRFVVFEQIIAISHITPQVFLVIRGELIRREHSVASCTLSVFYPSRMFSRWTTLMKFGGPGMMAALLATNPSANSFHVLCRDEVTWYV